MFLDDITWKTIPLNKERMKTYLKSQASKLELEDTADSESSDENLPENVLANHTELSSDNSDLDITKSNLYNVNDYIEDASVKSEPLSEEDISHTFKLNHSKKDKLKTMDNMLCKAKIKPCTSKEYNKFLSLEKKRNRLSLNEELDSITGDEESDRKSQKKKKAVDSDEENERSKKHEISNCENDVLSDKDDNIKKKKRKKHKKSLSDVEELLNTTNKIQNASLSLLNKSKKDKVKAKVPAKDDDSISEGDTITMKTGQKHKKSANEAEKINSSKAKYHNSSLNRSEKDNSRSQVRINDNSLSENEEVEKKKRQKHRNSFTGDEEILTNSRTGKGKSKTKAMNRSSSEGDDSISEDEIMAKKKEKTLQKILSNAKEMLNNSKNISQNSSLGSLNRSTKDNGKTKALIKNNSDLEDDSVSEDDGTKKAKRRKHCKSFDELNLSSSGNKSHDISSNFLSPKSENNRNKSKSPEKSMLRSRNDKNTSVIEQLNNLSQNSSDDSSTETKPRTSKNSLETSLSQNKLKNITKQDSSDSEIENPRYSFQFNRSYEINNDVDLNDSHIISPEKRKKDKNIIREKLINAKTGIDSPAINNFRKSNMFKNIINSTALDISNIADTSLPNVSQIPIPERNNKAPFYDLTEKEDESKMINKYLENNENLKKIEVIKSIDLESDSGDEEAYLVQCPRNINPALLIDQNILNSSFQYDGTAYNLTTIQNPIKDISLYIPGKCGMIKSLPLMGNIVIQSELKPASIKKIKKSKNTPVEFPSGLKIRHPLFGKSYKKKLILKSHVIEDLMNKKHKKSKKHKRKHEENPETDTMKHTKKRKNTSYNSEDDMPKKKRKKEIKQEKMWSSNDDIERNLFNM